ncbi:MULTISPECIES: hypothetical protein [Actinosynnema]|uniref:hypothetical protein n=1 Tax=Actinosynnema TaxID=40566 RepID=UPI0020A4CE9F|nr:hypothetical protein [Actinosynnema pretiosum]MCP2097353.1 hypothetical protein [Actinosynnema pretiosum]
MPRSIVNQHAGTCRLCDQDVPAETGLAVKGDEPCSTWQVEHAGSCPPHRHNPDSAPTWEISGGEGYGRQPFTPGASQREQWWTRGGGPGPDAVPGGEVVDESRDGNRQVCGVVTVVTARQRHYAEDGMSFGVGDEEGHIYWARVRAATETEAAPVLEAEVRQARRRELDARRRRLLDWSVGGAPDAWRPGRGTPELEGLRALPQVPLRPYDQRPLYGDELLLDEPGGWLWTVVHNGSDGADFSANNIGGHIATRHPLTDERRRLVADLGAEYGSAYEWDRAGVPDPAAWVLAEADVLPHEVTAPHCAVTITDVSDARAYLARTPRQWAQAGWELLSGRRWPATQAAELADAGIGHAQAERLRAAGVATVQQMLADGPPRVPDVAGRFVLSECTIGARVQVTDDPQEARRQLERDPGARAHPPHVPGVTATHVRTSVGVQWQLWSDGALSIGHWLQSGEGGRERPVSLSPAAETVLDLVVAAGNPEVRDRAVWHPLLTATGHRAMRVDGRERTGGELELVRHEVTLADGTVRLLWEVATWWSQRGEDGDEERISWISADEATARMRLLGHPPRRG